MTATTAKQLEVLKRELAFSLRELQRVTCADSESHESIDEIARSLGMAQTAVFEIGLQQDGNPSTEDQLMAA